MARGMASINERVWVMKKEDRLFLQQIASTQIMIIAMIGKEASGSRVIEMAIEGAESANKSIKSYEEFCRIEELKSL